MTEIDALKYELEQQEKSFNKLHKMYVSLLKQQGELEKENEQLKSFIKKLTNRNGEILLMNGYGYTKSYVEKLLNEKELEK